MSNSLYEPIEIPPYDDALNLTTGRKQNLLQKIHDCSYKAQHKS